MASLWSGEEGGMMLMVFSIIFLVVPVLINVAFFTLLERKILGLAQSRKGPNKVSFLGLLQPISDAVKLFMKEHVKPNEANILFVYAPMMAIFLSLFSWSLAPLQKKIFHLEYSCLILLVVLSVSLYPVLLAGWSSNSKYALIGSIRGVAQTLSYEISLAMVFFSFFCLTHSYELFEVPSVSQEYVFFFLSLPLFTLWLVSAVAETNRTPFDFAEGESELVSGFNIEFGSGLFALIFMAEYAMMMFFSLMSAQFLGITNNVMAMVITLAFCFVWVWIRATLPRFRYDLLMNVAWKAMLPLALTLAWFFFFC